jgi:hypothetical protein
MRKIIQKKTAFIVFILSMLFMTINTDAQSNNCAANNTGFSLVEITGRKLILKKRNPDGSLMPSVPFVINGICWSPASKTTNTSINDPNNVYIRRVEFLNWHQVDIPLIKRMNANTIRTFMDFGEGDTTKNILDKLYCNDIMVIMTVDDAINDTARIRRIVQANKNHPAILMWMIGNEWNINRYYGVASSVLNAAQRTQVAAALIKSLDPNHPVAAGYGDIDINDEGRRLEDTKNYVNNICTAVDVWGLNIYRGSSFGALFFQWKSITGKPMFLSEYGTDAFRSDNANPSPTGHVDEQMQANWDITLWKEIYRNCSAHHPANTTLGGTAFSLTDEWWKVPPFNSQETGGYAGPFPDGFSNEDYPGILDIDRKKRAAYDTLRAGFHPSYNVPASSIVFKAESAGYNVPGTSNGFAVFYKGLSVIYNGGGELNRGFNVVTIDTANGQLLTLPRYYDTWATATTGSEMRKMLQFLDSLPNGTLVMLAVRDEAGLTGLPPTCNPLPYTWVDSCYNALTALGSALIRNYCFRNSWAMVSVKGEGTARMEQLADSMVALAQTTVNLPPTANPPSLPLAPVLAMPQCNIQISDSSARLIWNKTDGAVSYRVQASEDSLFISNLINATIPDTSIQFNNLGNQKTYFWRVGAINAAGNGRWSCTGKFSVRIKPIATVIPAIINLPADTLKINYRFFNALNAGNNFIVQVTDTSGNAATYYALASIADNTRAGIFKIVLVGNTICSKKYRVRVLSTSPADTSDNSNFYEVINKPPKPVITQNATQLISSADSGNQWIADYTAIIGATGKTYQPIVSGRYRVLVAKNNCVSDTSDPVNFMLPVITDTTRQGGGILIYPNPFTSQITIVNNDSAKKLALHVYDITGRLLMRQNITVRHYIINTAKWPGGAYLILLTDLNGNETIKKRFIKQ